MTQWAAFSGIAAVVLVLVLLLARVSQVASDDAVPTGDTAPRRDATMSRRDDATPRRDATPTRHPTAGQPSAGQSSADDHDDPGSRSRSSRSGRSRSDRSRLGRSGSHPSESESLSAGALLANVALSQGAFCVILLAGAWYTRVPLEALGVDSAPASTGLRALVVGFGVGVALYLVNELGTRGANAVGIETPDALRASLAPESRAGWLVLLCGALPIVALFEELLFRAVLVGALSAGFGVSPWVLAVGSSILFALGHGAQGPLGMVVTGGLGLVLAGAFVLTGSLLVVVVAHYLVNALEFVVHEGFRTDAA